MGFPSLQDAAIADAASDADAADDGAIPDATVPDARADTGLPADAIYLGPSGDDTAAGTLDAPYRTFSKALSVARPGATVVALSGTYAQSTGTGLLDADCTAASVACEGAPCVDGTPSAPIVVRALVDQGATLRAEAGDTSNPVRLAECDYYHVEGFTILGLDDAENPWANVQAGNVEGFVLRRSLVARSNRFNNSHLVEIFGGSDILVEDNELYDFHRTAVLAYQARRVTVRRNYANARSYADLGGGFVSTYPESGDEAFSCAHSSECLFENDVSDGDQNKGFGMTTGLPVLDGLGGAGDDARFLGDLVVGANYGLIGGSSCAGMAACATMDERVIDGLTIADFVAIDTTSHGIFVRGARGVSVDSVTLLRSSFRVDVVAENVSLPCTLSVFGLLVSTGSDTTGVTILDQASYTLDFSNSFGTGTGFDTGADLSGFGMFNTEIDPMLGGCVHRIPRTSPMSGAGVCGNDIGARLVFRYVDGVQTVDSLWQADGSFPCRTIVPGINDGPNDCRTLHTRLGIGTTCTVQ